MNYRIFSLIALMTGICLMQPLGRLSAADEEKNDQNFFSGPVLLTPGQQQYTVCATNAALLAHTSNRPSHVLLALLDASTSRILAVREAALNPAGQGTSGDCLTVSATALITAANSQGPINVIAAAGNSLSAAQGFLIEGAGGIPGGGCITASLQAGDVDGNVRYIPMAQHIH